MAEASDAKPEVAAPAEPLEASEEVSEALLSHEKLPLELPGDNGATSSQAEGGRPTQGTPSMMASLPSPGNASRQPAGPPGQMTTPGTSGVSGKWRGPSVRASPMSATTQGPRVPPQDPAIFTVTDRKVRVREHEKNTPLYVLCRKWVQNEPDTELMPPKDRAEEVAAKEREAATIKLPPIPQPTEEEEAQAARLPEPEEPLPQSQKERPTIEVLKRQHQDHWLGVRMHNSEKFTLKMRRFRSRLNTLLTLSAPPAEAA
ncbi:hypothetical protein COCSUDRAFT_40490 [Coccomyxa subellipsoidea C-169]|uniref:Uncharacterized protein n=1 Tax=Coccomyxa subellipsoidea (strain C-169) TaxID=574566 RepID=I0Z3E5_COCSC|nr:hypothetical protein COCSUDRAFT_40490 [Coccomyxa subellipsoidea C-169]EIE25164.1 hypothetical protein COCSUDRAFT_40490 [Coccomyxa subellipsoidea C-169]|eukprot:XP_005649708.1 hypothetical protein COCSUDRAFT_40490 [Coccomyxa subellipsoidea C-169]